MLNNKNYNILLYEKITLIFYTSYMKKDLEIIIDITENQLIN